MIKEFEFPTIEVIKIDTPDVIATSLDLDDATAD